MLEVPAILPRYRSDYHGKTLQVFFGDLHQHSEFSGCGRRDGRIDQNQSYTRDVRGLDFMATTDHGEHLNDHNWRVTQLTARRSYRPGEFVAFSGFEWTSEFDAGGNLYRGHYNAIFRENGGGDTFFSASDPRTNTPQELWKALEKAVGGEQNVLTFPHHPGRRDAWLSWNYYDPRMAPLIEIAQVRGSYEGEGCPTGLKTETAGARIRGHDIQDGLSRGMRWGFIAGGDHGGRQLAAVFSPELTREAIFDALKARRTYATSGERMFLDVRVNDHFMGEEFVQGNETRTIEVRARGTAPLSEIDLVRNGRSIQKWVGGGSEFEIRWLDREPLPERENSYYVRAVQEGGGLAWSSPIWVRNSEVPGTFRFQIGGDELHLIYPEQDTDFSILMHNGTDRPVHGTAVLLAPPNWRIKEGDGIPVECPAGSWGLAVFHLTAPSASLTEIGLPQVTARLEMPGGQTRESSLFVVGSPVPISKEQRALLIEARAATPPSRFPENLKKMAESWRKQSDEKK
jgi:hypothetical protein